MSESIQCEGERHLFVMCRDKHRDANPVRCARRMMALAIGVSSRRRGLIDITAVTISKASAVKAITAIPTTENEGKICGGDFERDDCGVGPDGDFGTGVGVLGTGEYESDGSRHRAESHHRRDNTGDNEPAVQNCRIAGAIRYGRYLDELMCPSASDPSKILAQRAFLFTRAGQKLMTSAPIRQAVRLAQVPARLRSKRAPSFARPLLCHSGAIDWFEGFAAGRIMAHSIRMRNTFTQW